MNRRWFLRAVAAVAAAPLINKLPGARSIREGCALRIESLYVTMKVVTYKQEHIRLWKDERINFKGPNELLRQPMKAYHTLEAEEELRRALAGEA